MTDPILPASSADFVDVRRKLTVAGSDFLRKLLAKQQVQIDALSTAQGHITDLLASLTDSNGNLLDLSDLNVDELAAIAAVQTPGMMVRDAQGQWYGRTLTGTANLVTVTNDDGTQGNPTVTIPNDAITNAKLANMAAHTLKANITGSSADPVDSTLSAILDAEIGSTRGKIAVRGASAWQALALGSNGQAVVSDGTDAKWGSVGAAAGGGYATLGSVVAGSSVTSLTVSGLDLSLYKAFKIYFFLKDAAASGTGAISLFYNSDTTATDYNEQSLTLNGATVTGARANDARMGNLDSGRYVTGFIEIEKDVNGRASALIFSNRDNSAGIIWQSAMHVWSTSFANVTGITMSSSIASQFAAGSAFAVYGITL